jgi:hypothetical protein
MSLDGPMELLSRRVDRVAPQMEKLLVLCPRRLVCIYLNGAREGYLDGLIK